ncbi:hypothetical protein EMIT051CA3_60396 [Pseudomonas chlororaphis]
MAGYGEGRKQKARRWAGFSDRGGAEINAFNKKALWGEPRELFWGRKLSFKMKKSPKNRR